VGLSTTRPRVDGLDQLRARVGEALDGDVDDVLAAHEALAAALDADPGSDELRALIAELVQEGAIARLRVLERVRAALARLADAGPVSEIVERAPAEAAAAIDLHRVLLSRVEDGWLVAEALHWEGDAKNAEQTLARLRSAPVQIAYPLVEGELLRRRRAAIVTPDDGEPATRQANWEVMRWTAYLAAPVIMDGRVVGFLHGDRDAGPLRAADRQAMTRFAEGFSDIYERAVLRRRLRVERQELRRIATWADARTAELSDGAIDLARDRQAPDGEESDRPPAARSALRDLLTPRELDVLEHLVRGETNADIARSLVVSEGTVKFHVKNILRKMNAANRAEATSRYLRLSLGRDE
jgi:LuxR family transcriptional regulator, regulator of acetate metabolism